MSRAVSIPLRGDPLEEHRDAALPVLLGAAQSDALAPTRSCSSWSRFDRITGVPVVLNTSFNVRGEPMVNRPREAVADFCRTAMDALVIRDQVLEKTRRQVGAPDRMAPLTA